MQPSRLPGHNYKENRAAPSASILPSHISLEFQALLCACRVFFGAEEPFALEALMRQVTDWSRLLALASSHGVMPLLYHAVSQTCPGTVPKEWTADFRMLYMQNAARNYKMTSELLRILDALNGAGIRAVPMKGPALAQQVYGDIAMRQFVDLDILVVPGDVEGALRIMQACGYRGEHELSQPKRRALMKTAHHHHLFNAQSGVTAELHWMIAPRYYGMKTDATGIMRRAEAVTLMGKNIAGISAGDMLMLLCQHGTKHTWERLSWICDVAGLAAKEGERLTEARLRAMEAGEERVFLLGLFLAKELMGAKIPDDIVLQARGDEALAGFARQSMKRLFADAGGHGTEDLRNTQVDRSLLYMSLYRSPYRKACYFLGMITDPADVDMGSTGLPEGMLPLYRLIKLARMTGTYGGAFCGWLRRSRSG